ncbi:hypothetical protein LCGC14_2898080 [marine sediment metagenome]|uniref:Uncharacterized protein n=1 Tax=marine sediment metagenome TaxID=412755 RepID=A0A0F8YH35_9ZZZZ
MILLSCTKHPGYTGGHQQKSTIINWECLACRYIYKLRQEAEARTQLGVKVGEACEAWKVEDAIKRTD